MDTLPIGPYKPDATEHEAFNHVDEFDMFATHSPNKGRGDSLGGGQDMYFCYDDTRFVFSAEKLWYFDSYGKYIGQRHPLVHPDDHPMSRDHYMSTMITLKMHYDRTGSTASMAKIKEITDNTGYIISKMARRGLGLGWWSKAIQGKTFYQFLYHMMGIVEAVFVYLPMHMIFAEASFSEEVDQWQYVPYPEGKRLQELPKWKHWVSKACYPSYALQNAGWQLYVTDKNKLPLLRRIHEAVYRPMIGKTNYVQKMLFGVKGIQEEYISFYKAMMGGRWGGYLSERNDRNMHVLNPQPHYNNIDVDVARKLYNETQL
jgi:hypothetical protein